MSIRKEIKICKFCGRSREVIYDIHGDCDEGGRTYGIHETCRDKGCVCKLGQISFNKSQKITKMCLNCRFNVGGKCENAATIKSVSTVFSVGDLKINDSVRNKCDNWKINQDIFKELI